MTASPEPSLPVGRTSTTLLQQLREHDPDAWRRLVRLYGPLVDFWLRRAGLQAADAEDVFQSVFQSVAQGIADFRKEANAGSFRGWLRTITRSKVADHYRQQAKQPRAAGGSSALRRLQELADWPEDDPDETRAVRDVYLRALELVRAEFEDRTWQAVWRVIVQGHAVRDVAQDLGITPSAVRLFKTRVLRRLRDELTELGES